MKRLKLFKHTSTSIITIYVIIVICLYFWGKSISLCFFDWGNFGSYFGGMLSLLSVILLYYTLREQRKENHRNWFESGFIRKIHALDSYCSVNMDSLHCLAAKVLDTCEPYPFGGSFQYEDAKIALSNNYEENLYCERSITEGLYYQFKSIIEYIIIDDMIDEENKDRYINELELSLDKESLVTFICVACNHNDDKTLSNLKKHHAFSYFQTGQSGFDVLKDSLFNYKRNHIMEQKKNKK